MQESVVSTAAYAEGVGVSRATAIRHLSHLITEGRIEDGPRNVGTGHEVPNPAWLTGPTVSFIASFETVVPLDPVTVKTILGDRRRSVKGDRTGVQAIARVLDRAGVVRDWCAGMPDNQRLLPNARRWTLIERQFVRHSSLLPAELPVPLCAVRAQVRVATRRGRRRGRGVMRPPPLASRLGRRPPAIGSRTGRGVRRPRSRAPGG